MKDICYDCALRSQTLFLASHLVLAVWQGKLVRAPYRITRKECVAVKRLRVLAHGARFKPAAFDERQVAGRKGIIHLKRLCNLSRDEAIAASSHPVIKLCQKQRVAFAYRRVFL